MDRDLCLFWYGKEMLGLRVGSGVEGIVFGVVEGVFVGGDSSVFMNWGDSGL